MSKLIAIVVLIALSGCGTYPGYIAPDKRINEQNLGRVFEQEGLI